MKKQQLAYFLLPPLLFLLSSIITLNAQDYHNKYTLSDSIRHELNKESIDTISLSQLLYQIRTKRIELGSDYKSLLTEYIKRSKDKEYLTGQMEALDRLGLQERFDENYEKAIDYHMQSMQIALNLEDSMQLTYNFNNIGQAYRKQDLNGLAIRYFHSALKIQEQIGDTRGAYFTQNTLGATYLVQEEYKKALFYLHRSLEQAIKRGDKRTMSYNYGSLGEVYLAKNQIDSALHYFKLGKTLKKELNFDKGMVVSDHLIGQALFAKEEYTKAQKMIKGALQNHEKYKNERYQALCLAYLGKIELAKGKLDNAEQYLTKAKSKTLNKHSLENIEFTEYTLTKYNLIHPILTRTKNS